MKKFNSNFPPKKLFHFANNSLNAHIPSDIKSYRLSDETFVQTQTYRILLKQKEPKKPLTWIVVDTEGTQHLFLFWHRPHIFGLNNFRDTQGPNRMRDEPILCIWRHSWPFWKRKRLDISFLIFVNYVLLRNGVRSWPCVQWNGQKVFNHFSSLALTLTLCVLYKKLSSVLLLSLLLISHRLFWHSRIELSFWHPKSRNENIYWTNCC